MNAALAGLPDFATIAASQTATTIAAFGTGPAFVLPQALTFAAGVSGLPSVSLELVERFGDFAATGSYAILDQTLAWNVPLDAGLVQTRERGGDATVKPLPIAIGFARLYPLTSQVLPASDALAPLQLGWTRPDGVRFINRLSLDAGELVKGALASGSLLLGVRVEFSAAGVGTRTDASVSFDPAALFAALLAGKSTPALAVPDLLSACAGALPLAIAGTRAPEFAQALADRIVEVYGTFVPAPAAGDPPFVSLAPPAAGSTVTWDLSVPATTYRHFVYDLATSPELAAAVAANGTAPFVKDVTIPPLELGVYAIDVTANLPPGRSGVPAIGVDVQIDAHPPERPSGIGKRLTLVEPQDEASASVHLSPNEALSYEVTPFAVVAAGQAVREYRAATTRSSAAWLQLQASDFPVSFAHVTVAPRLAGLATISLDLAYDFEGVATQSHFTLNAQAPGIAIGIPQDATGAALSITATPLDGSAALSLADEPFTSRLLDFNDFREYGPHTVAIACDFAPGDPPLILDLQSRDRSLVVAGAADQLYFIPSQATATWGFVASSPFAAAYRYRLAARAAAGPGPWSPFVSPFESLRLRPDGSQVQAGSGELATA